MILIKFATRERPELFKRTIDNIYDTISGKVKFQILVTVDRDDMTMLDDAQMMLYLANHREIVYSIGESHSKIHAINRSMETADKRWEMLLNVSDDMKFLVKDWDLKMLEHIRSVWGDSLDYFAHFNDGHVGDALATMSIMGRDYYERDKYIYYPEYKSFSCDAEAWFVAQARGRHHYFPEVYFEHVHPTFYANLYDELYRKNSLHTPDDERVFWERLHNDFGVKEEGLTGPFIWDVHKKY